MSEKLDPLLVEVYRKGFADGLTAYAHWQDGEQIIGASSGHKLKDVIANMEEVWNYNPEAK